MTRTTKLDTLSTRLEEVVKLLQSDDVPKRKRMPLSEFMTFALTEIQKAAKDKPEVAKRRLATLKRNVDEVIAAIAKLAAEDTESEDIDVEVTTAFAPTKAEGDTPMDDLTTGSDQSSTEVSLAGVSPASEDSAFTENLDQVAKALQKLKDDLGEPSDEKPRTRAKKADANRVRDRGERGERGDGDRDADGWPLDLATDTFLKGDAATEADPVWGYDPAGVASPKAR
jgi:hypothetical protein